MTSHLAAAAISILLVHGGFVDGSGWQSAYKTLKHDGYNVTVVQNPTITLDDDVAFVKRAIAREPGPVLLVGHSYGGAVITQAGNDSKVKGLVYIAAFAPDEGESLGTLLGQLTVDDPHPPILPPQDGFLMLDKAQFPASFAGDVNADEADFMANSQVPWGVVALATKITSAAWKTKPSWYLLTTADRMIPPHLQKMMAQRANATVEEVNASHAVYVSQPQAVASIIEKAANAIAASK